MAKMDVSLTPELEEFVQEQIQKGRFDSESEVFRAALRLFQAQDLVNQLRSEKLRQEVRVGLEQARRGEVDTLDVEAIKKRGRDLLASRRASAERS